jgi:lipooligosaccharide transport system permease protein
VDTGFGFAATGAILAARIRSWHAIDIVIGGIIAPMFVVAGTFFPLEGLPRWAELAGRVNPLHHAVELLRGAAFGFPSAGTTLLHVGALVAFDVLAWLLAVRFVRRALID